MTRASGIGIMAALLALLGVLAGCSSEHMDQYQAQLERTREELQAVRSGEDELRETIDRLEQLARESVESDAERERLLGIASAARDRLDQASDFAGRLEQQVGELEDRIANLDAGPGAGFEAASETVRSAGELFAGTPIHLGAVLVSGILGAIGGVIRERPKRQQAEQTARGEQGRAESAERETQRLTDGLERIIAGIEAATEAGGGRLDFTDERTQEVLARAMGPKGAEVFREAQRAGQEAGGVKLTATKGKAPKAAEAA